MRLPYDRPRFIELHEQSWLPAYLRQPVQDFLSIVWLTKVPILQQSAPYEAVDDALNEIIEILDTPVEAGARDEEDDRDEGIDVLRIVDCCSGAGGPMPAIEQNLNRRRRSQSRRPVSILLSDIQPHLSAWKRLASRSASATLGYLPYPVDATRAPEKMTKQRHFRTFCLAFHHFDEEGAIRVLEDAMRTADGIGIFELQTPDFGSLLTITGLFPLTLLLTPFYHPIWTTLLFTYIIPIIPFILVFDGYISSWRTRSFPHILHLAEIAKSRVDSERESNGLPALEKWSWRTGRKRHTWPFGYMTWIVGTNDGYRS